MSPSLVTRPRLLAAGLLLVAALLAGCGGDDTGGSPVVAPTGGARETAAPDEPADAVEYQVQPGTYVEPESEIEPESDAERWVDRRQDDVLNDVHENNLESTEVWTP